MAYKVECLSCGDHGQVPQNRCLKLADHRCKCGGKLRRIGWQEMQREHRGLPSAGEAAAVVLRETGNTGIGWGDAHLLHAVAARLGLPPDGPHTEKAVLERIERSYRGVLVKGYHAYPSRGLSRVRRYTLPEYVTTGAPK